MAGAKSRWLSFGKFSGLARKGTVAVAPPAGADADLHVERAFYLVSQLEASHWGSVQSYDGAGVSGGPLHNIAYLKATGDQGSLFQLIQAIQRGREANGSLSALQRAFHDAGWQLADKGPLRLRDSNKAVPGDAILDELAPKKGKVPESGPARDQAERWLRLFGDLFSDPLTFAAQKRFAIDALLSGQAPLEASIYDGVVGQPVNVPRLRVADDSAWNNAVDLAMCVYHAHSVNAPAVARKCLEQAIDRQSPAREGFAATLIHALGTRKYGRWADTDDDKNRYDRTRIAAMKSKLWPAALFAHDGIMPENLDAKPRPVATTPPRTVAAASPSATPTDAAARDVTALQQRLTALGYRPGDIDGRLGGQTLAAIRRFQTDHGLPATGKLTAATEAALRTSPGRAATVTREQPAQSAQNRVDAFVYAPLRTPLHEPQRTALAAYWERCQDEPVAFAERMARTAEWFLSLGVQEERGENTGPWVDFLRITGGGQAQPTEYPPWCAFFVSACLRITNWVEPYGMTPVTGGSATRLYLKAPRSARVEHTDVAALADPRGAIFVRTRTSQPVSERDTVLRGKPTNGHTGIVVGREPDGSLLCIAGNSSGVGHSSVAGSGAVAMETIGPSSAHARKALDRLVGLVLYDAPAPRSV